jgi:glyoxylase-like metal-dependent hydrolase (beta-lactamase superfamily II)
MPAARVPTGHHRAAGAPSSGINLSAIQPMPVRPGETTMILAHRRALSRRGFCLCCASASAMAAGGGWLTPRQAFAEAQGIVELIRSEAAKAPIAVHRLRGNVAALEGSGGNIAVLSGRDGKVLVDAGIAVSRPQLTRALEGLGPEPVTHLINTHWHFDHTNGNEWLHELGPKILAHENTRKHLATMQRVEDWNFDFPPLSDGALPSEVFATESKLVLNDAAMELKYYGPAHTDSDISVHLTEPDILHTGDTFWNGIYPFIDYSTGGSIDGSIRAAEANLTVATDQTIIIPGHGQAVSNRAQLLDFRDMLVAIRENVAALKKQGRSLSDTVAAKPTAAYDAKWGQFVIGPALFTKLVYKGV